MVRVMNKVIDHFDISDILSTYKGGSNTAFNPKVMLKILAYTYLCNIHSSRKIAQQLCENINFMRLAGMKRTGYRTINYFRRKRLKESFESVFTQLMELLHKQGFVTLNVQYIDGTKIESSANKYTFAWRRTVEKYDANSIRQLLCSSRYWKAMTWRSLHWLLPENGCGGLQPPHGEHQAADRRAGIEQG